MKRVTLREDRAPYLVNEEILSDEPVIVERNGQAVAAVIPIADYEAFRHGEPPWTSRGLASRRARRRGTWRRWQRWSGSGPCSRRLTLRLHACVPRRDSFF